MWLDPHPALKRMLTRVFTVLDVSTDKEPFLRLMISLDATEAQEAEVYNLMGKVDEQLSQSEAAMDHLAFCERVHEIFPSQQPQHLAEAVVTRLARTADGTRSMSTCARAA